MYIGIRDENTNEVRPVRNGDFVKMGWKVSFADLNGNPIEPPKPKKRKTVSAPLTYIDVIISRIEDADDREWRIHQLLEKHNLLFEDEVEDYG